MKAKTENAEFKARFSGGIRKEENAFADADSGDSFEVMRSMEQDLSFETAENVFRKAGIPLCRETFRTLGIIREDDERFTNLALLLSDQCAHTIKVAVFGDAANTVFMDHKEFRGSVFKQLETAFDYLKLCNRIESSFSGLVRVDKPDYPEEAFREALLNALVHRDYRYGGSIIINVNGDRMEFISLGGLPSGLSAENIRTGISRPRNRFLAELFHHLHLTEGCGSGIPGIWKLYEHSPVRPVIEASPHAFKLVLPNLKSSDLVRKS